MQMLGDYNNRSPQYSWYLKSLELKGRGQTKIPSKQTEVCTGDLRTYHT